MNTQRFVKVNCHNAETLILYKTNQMLRIILGLLCITVIAASCLKSSDTGTCPYGVTTINAPQAERDSIEAFLDSNNITALEHSSGFYYQIIEEGAGESTPGLCSEITINYTGKFKNGNQFDGQNGVRFILGSLIEGWKKGIPLIKKGGQLKLFVPPSLGYGSNPVTNNGQVVIPANSMLIFDVTLIDFTIDN